MKRHKNDFFWFAEIEIKHELEEETVKSLRKKLTEALYLLSQGFIPSRFYRGDFGNFCFVFRKKKPHAPKKRRQTEIREAETGEME